MQRIAAGEGNTLAFDAGVIQIVNDLVFHCFGKWLTGIYPPGAFVIATGAFMNTPGDKQGAASAGAVDDVDRIVLMIIHYFAWLISPRVGGIRQSTPDATLLRLIRPTAVAKCRPDKAFTPHPAFA